MSDPCRQTSPRVYPVRVRARGPEPPRPEEHPVPLARWELRPRDLRRRRRLKAHPFHHEHRQVERPEEVRPWPQSPDPFHGEPRRGRAPTPKHACRALRVPRRNPAPVELVVKRRQRPAQEAQPLRWRPVPREEAQVVGPPPPPVDSQGSQLLHSGPRPAPVPAASWRAVPGEQESPEAGGKPATPRGPPPAPPASTNSRPLRHQSQSARTG